MRTFIAETDRTFRVGLVDLIRRRYPKWIVRDTDDVLELRNALRAATWDLLFVDLSLIESLSNAKDLRNRYPCTRFIAVDDVYDRLGLNACKQAKLAGYIARDTRPSDLIINIESIIRSGEFFSTYENAAVEWLPDRLAARRDGEGYTTLTARQHDVLNLLAEGRSTKDIARRLGLAVPTVKTHLAAAYRQLGARNRVEAVVKMRSMPLGNAMTAMLGMVGNRTDSLYPHGLQAT